MHLLEVTNPLVPSAESMYPALVGSVIWGVLSLAMFVWYLWSLSRLFPLLGVKGAWGWIPVWNQWQLLQRAGLPGWLVLLVLVPGVGALVVLVMTIIAMHRINTEFGKGAGMTVLGAFIAPLWATLLAQHISKGRYGAAAGWAPVREGAAAGVGTLQGLPQAHVPPQSAPGYGAGQYANPQGLSAPAASAQQYQGQAQQHPAQQPYGQPTHNPAGAFVPNYSSQVPAQRSAFAPPLVDTAAAAPAAEVVADPSAAPAHPVPATPAGQPAWGFSPTTVNDYERLAAEGRQPVTAAPLGVPVQQQTFSWPAPQQSDQVTQTGAPASVETSLAELGLADLMPADEAERSAPQTAASQAEISQAEVSPAAMTQTFEPQTFAPQTYAAPILAAVPDLPVVPSAPVMQAVPVTPLPVTPVPLVPPVVPAAPAAASSVTAPVTPQIIAAKVMPVESAIAAPMTQAAVSDDYDDDATVVVRRGTRWGLELPDGETLELLGTDVVVGRRPEPTGSYEVLQINDQTRTLSKSHVRLRRTGEVWTVEDLHSTNGVSLVDDAGMLVELEAGHEQAATEHMLIGTLEVRLVRIP